MVEYMKSDKVLAAEIQDIFDQYVEKANELLARGLVVSFSMSNGADGKPVVVNNFVVTKKVLEVAAAKQDNQ
jgi:hypothetical protein